MSVDNFANRPYKIITILTSMYTILLFCIFILTWFNITFFNYIDRFSVVILFYLNFIIFICYSPTIYSKKKSDFFIYFLVLMILTSNTIFSNTGIGSLLVFFNFFTMLLLYKYIKVSDKLITILSFFMFLLFVYYFLSLSNLSFNNNSIGYIFLITYIYTSIFFFNKGKLKYLLPLLTFVAIISIFATENRSSLIGLILFLLLAYVIPSKIWGNKIIYPTIIYALTIGSLIFVLTYVYLWRNNISFDLPFTNKFIYSGREYIWNELIINFQHNPIVGLGSNYNIKTYENLNVHNSMFNILVIYGIPIFVITVIMMINRLKGLSIYNTRNAKVAIAGFFSILIVGFFETNLVWSSINFPGLFLIVIAYHYQKECKS